MKHTEVSQTRHETPTPPLLFMMWPNPVASVDLSQWCTAGATSARTKTQIRI